MNHLHHIFQDLPFYCTKEVPDFLLQKTKSGFNTVRLPCGKPGICSDNSCGTHSLRFRKPEVGLKVEKPKDLSENLPTGGPLGTRTFPRSWAPRESLISLRTSLGQNFPDNSCGFSTVCPRQPQTLLLLDNSTDCKAL